MTKSGHAIEAGLVYVLIVFLFGFALGTIRVLLLVPRLGAVVAVMLEIPIMLAISWVLSRWCTQRFAVPAELRSRLLMAAIAFVCLMSLELGLSIAVFGNTLSGYVVQYRTLSGVMGFASQVCFALMLIFQLRWRG